MMGAIHPARLALGEGVQEALVTRIFPLLLAAALLAGCKETAQPAPAAPPPAAPAPAAPAAPAPTPKAAIPADHNLDLNGKLHMPGLREPERNCASCHGADLHGGSASSCFECHGKAW